MQRIQISMNLVPSNSQGDPYFMLYVSTYVWEGSKPSLGPALIEKKVYWPDAELGKLSDWAIDVADRMYQELTMAHAAKVNDRYNEGVNARPSDTSTI